MERLLSRKLWQCWDCRRHHEAQWEWLKAQCIIHPARESSVITPSQQSYHQKSRRGLTPRLTRPPVSFSDVLFERLWQPLWPAHWSSACVLLVGALYDINTTIVGRRIPTVTSPDEFNACDPLNRQQRLTIMVTLTPKLEGLSGDGIVTVVRGASPARFGSKMWIF